MPIFVVLFSRKKADSKKSCCFLILGSKFSDLEFSPDEKSVGDPEKQCWESNRGQQWLSRTGQIKNFQGFCWRQNFVLFTSQIWRDNSNIFKQVFFALCLLIDEEILRPKRGRKNMKLLLKKTYDSTGKKCLILKSKNKSTMVARPIARAACSHETDIWPFWSTAAGDQEIVRLQKTDWGFRMRRIHI